jgi:hypothetical protein
VVFVENLSVKNLSRRAKPKQDETGKFHPNGQSAKSGLNKVLLMRVGVNSLISSLSKLQKQVSE